MTDPARPTPGATLTGRTGIVFSVAFSPDGRLLATGSANRVLLWNVEDPRRPSQVAELAGHANNINVVTFDPVGHLFATASADGTARLWDITDPRYPETLAIVTGQTGVVYSVAFDPDRPILATGGTDHTARLWDISDPRHPRPLATLSGHTDTINSVAFAPDGHTLIGGNDTTSRLWETNMERVVAQICEIVHPTITYAEWSEYFPGLTLHPTLPVTRPIPTETRHVARRPASSEWVTCCTRSCSVGVVPWTRVNVP